jgi:predicted N-formylglutamate amidohydrolase
VTVVDLPPRNLLAADEPPAFEVLANEPRHPALLVCDHASRRIPRALSQLGLPESALQRHIAWDIGAGALVRALAAMLEIPAVLASYSRLVIDCNRHLEDPSSIVAESDGQTIFGNTALNAAQREARARACFWPYHRAVDESLEALLARGRVPALIAIHSFTPQMLGIARPWHCGILWDRDPRIPLPLLDALRANQGLVVGDNEPYSGRHPADYTVDVHAENRGWPHVCIEVRQDLIADAEGIETWSRLLARALEPILLQDTLYREQRFLDPASGVNEVLR